MAEQRPAAVGPYFWRGDVLCTTTARGVVAVAAEHEFPQLVRLRRLRQQQTERIYPRFARRASNA